MKWEISSFSRLTDKMQFQKMILPEGIEYDIDFQCYRTPRANSLIAQIVEMQRVSGENKKRKSSSVEKNSVFVRQTGIEPDRVYS